MQEFSSGFGSFLNQIAIFIAVPVLVVIAWNLWVSYINTLFLNGIKWVLLEIKPPKDVFKSPVAMELMLNALYQTGGTGNFFDKYWKGNLRNYFSLEIVSVEGKIRFFIRTNAKFQKIIETQIYAQYPQAEVKEVPDYTLQVPEFTKHADLSLWGCRFVLTKEDAYPIKTYVDYGLDRAVGSLEEEERIDPITPTLEYMGSIGAGEQVWFQIIVRADTSRFTVKNDKGEEESGKSWKDSARALIKKLRKEMTTQKDGDVTTTVRETRGQSAIIESIERNLNKFGFDAGIRAIYLAKKENFNADMIAGLTGAVRQYNSSELNGFKPEGPTAFDFPWQDLLGNRIIEKKAKLLSAYKKRYFFYRPFDFFDIKSYFTSPGRNGEKPFILTTEELATMYHLPGRVAETPTFTRIEAKKAEPPANLPI